MSNSKGLSHEAIVFFDDGKISKQMLLTEFDALLDGVVPMRDFVGKELQAAYVRLNPQLFITSTVFFLIRFDERGYPDSSWNVPLNKMAADGMRGPDLGGGQVKMATRSQCPIQGREDDLWDPVYGAAGNTLTLLQEALKENRVGFDIYDEDQSADAATAPPLQAAPAPQAAPQAMPTGVPAGAPQADAVMAAMQQHSEQIAALRDQHRQELESYNQQFAALQERMQVVDNEKRELLGQLQSYGASIEEAQQVTERREQELLAERDTAIAEAVAARTAEIEAGLAEQENRRNQQEEQLNSLRAELTDLRRSKLRLLEGGADNFLERITEKGIKFVAFHPGAGHVNIALEDMNEYMENTEAFVAARCKVSVEHYQAWLSHYNKPSCQGHASRDNLCGKPVQKQLKPAEFVVGIHDRCDIHRRGELPKAGAGRGA